MSGWTDGSSGEGAGADDGYGFDDGGGAGQTALSTEGRSAGRTDGNERRILGRTDSIYEMVGCSGRPC